MLTSSSWPLPPGRSSIAAASATLLVLVVALGLVGSLARTHGTAAAPARDEPPSLTVSLAEAVQPVTTRLSAAEVDRQRGGGAAIPLLAVLALVPLAPLAAPLVLQLVRPAAPTTRGPRWGRSCRAPPVAKP